MRDAGAMVRLAVRMGLWGLGGQGGKMGATASSCSLGADTCARLILTLVLSVATAACGGPTPERRAETAADLATLRAQHELSGKSYEEVEGRSSCPAGDCSEEDAGFAYAQEQGLETPDGCGTEYHSQTFTEGCEAYGRRIAAHAEAARQSILQAEARTN